MDGGFWGLLSLEVCLVDAFVYGIVVVVGRFVDFVRFVVFYR
jgi:hypothetical protein